MCYYEPMAKTTTKLTERQLESKHQKEVMKWLKQQGCDVYKMHPGMGIPDGTEDVLFLKEGFWGFLECKASKNAEHRPGQDRSVERHSKMSYSRFCYPENWAEIQKELSQML